MIGNETLNDKTNLRMLDKIKAVRGSARVNSKTYSNGTIVYQSEFLFLTGRNDDILLRLSGLPSHNQTEEVQFCAALNKGDECITEVLEGESFSKLRQYYWNVFRHEFEAKAIGTTANMAST